jgi:glycosyltransferase involved in cell wall biosynthesis
MTPRFSLVIPAYNEEAYLPRLLDSIEVARQAYAGGRDAIEVIVTDNGSSDGTAAIARARGCRVVFEATRVIGASRNAGGRAARGEIVAFVDADMLIHPQTFNAIDAALAKGGVVAGATSVWPDRWSAGIVATFAAMIPFALLLKIDTGVVFCRRQDFLAVGGYSEKRLFAEDVQFLYDLWRLGRRRGDRLVRVTSARAIASTRKFDKYGEWHFFVFPLRLALDRLRSGAARERWARRYWYEDR